MEINRFDKVQGVVTKEAIVEGRFVTLGEHTETHGFGSREDLLGAKVPTTADEAARAKYVVTWPVSNGPVPFYEPTPSYDWSLRAGGFDQAANVPFDARVYLTYPGYTDGATIPSGNLALAFTEGVFTIPSGGFVYDADIIKPGAALVVGYSGGEEGKLKYTAALAVGVVGFTEEFDSTSFKLRVRVE
jgi:hypothetical protein